MTHSKREHLVEQHRKSLASLGEERPETDEELQRIVGDYDAQVEVQRGSRERVSRVSRFEKVIAGT